MTIYEKMDHLGLFVYIQWEIFSLFSQIIDVQIITCLLLYEI